MGWQWILILLSGKVMLGYGCLEEMDDGSLFVNCSGSYVLRTVHGKMIHPCGLLNDTDLCGPLEVKSPSCRAVVIKDACTIDEGTIRVQIIVLWVVVSVILLTICLCLVMWVGLIRLSRGENTTTQIRYSRVIIRDEEGPRVLKYSRLLVAGLLLMGAPSSASTCIKPHHISFDGTSSTYKFKLLPGSSACFTEGSVLHVESDVLAETSLLYKTAEWNHHTWTMLACGEGNCGTKDQCAAWGEHGKIIDGPKDRGQYKKYCVTNLQPWTSCFYSWGCWLATNEISWDESREWEVSSIGEYTPSDDYLVSGLEDCSIAILDQSSDSLRGDYLMTNNKTAMICKYASEEGYPESGRLGDLQIVGNKTIFDYTAFSCDLSTAYSSGSCKVEESGVLVSKGRCMEMPTTIAMEHLRYADGDLHVSPLAPREFSIRCPRNLTVHESDHNCNSVEVEVHGLRSEQDFTFLTFKSNSPGSKSSYPVPKDCHMEEVEIPCDGVEHVIRSYSYPVHNCFPPGSSFTDKTVEPEVPTWSWDHDDHFAFGQSGSYRSMIIYAIGLLAVLILLKIIFS